MTRTLRRWVILCCLTVLGLTGFYRLQDVRWEFTELMWRPRMNAQRPIDWKNRQNVFPVSSYIPLPSGSLVEIPDIQAIFPVEPGNRKAWRLKRQAAVRDVFVRSWKAYKKYAWMHDEVSPISGEYKDTFGGWGASLVDALDMLWITGMEEEFASAVVALHKIDFTRSPRDQLNVFETTIRYLGGLLSAYDVSDGKYPILLQKAIELGDMLYAAFDTPNRMPVTRWFWQVSARQFPQEAHSHALSAEIGSLSVEFTRLSQLTNDPKYFDAVQRISDALEQQQDDSAIPGLWPIVFNAAEMNFTRDKTFTIGGMSDSLFEYIPKEYLLLGGQKDQYRSMYEKFVVAAKEHLFFRPMTPDNRDILISGTTRQVASGEFKLDPEGQHLTCFIGGLLGISSKIFTRPEDLITAKQLVNGCIWAYEASPNGIMPELFRTWPCPDQKKCLWDEEEWYKGVIHHATSIDKKGAPKLNLELAHMVIGRLNLPKGFTDIRDTRYVLRPEAIESVFIMYRITGDRKYQEIAWSMFAAIERSSKTDISYAALSNVMTKNPPQIDSQESFWMAETLKYFYLIFSEPDVISLDDYVFNTEAHPLKRPKTST